MQEERVMINERLLQDIDQAKRIEKNATAHRVQLESELYELLTENQLLQEGKATTKIDTGKFTVKVTVRTNTSIDDSMLQEIAAENNTENLLGSLFRWKPTIDKKAWDAASEADTLPFTKAITEKVGRPTIQIDENIEV
jgi:hypothetical protein